jgi:hypothetical protein
MPDGVGLTDAALREGGPPPAPAVKPGFLDEVSGWFASVRATLSGFVDLLALEAHRAVKKLMWMAVGAVVAAICIVSAWLGLMTALVLWAVSLGVSTTLAVFGVAVINAAAGALLIFLSIRISRDLLFPATRRQLAGKSPVKPITP